MAKQPQNTAAGLVVVDKPGGVTSHGVVARVRRLAGTRKVGHAGTLDPMATGVLLLGVNRATRLLGHLMLTAKGYDATIRLGMSTVTDDAEGEQLTRTDASHVTRALVEQVLAGYVGEIQQVPTAVSAIKVDGQRAYALVRAGEEVQLKARTVTIHRLEVGEVRIVDGFCDVDISMNCSSGTYVRAVARDLGAELSVGGHLTMLRRTAVGPFDLSAARTLDQLDEEFSMLSIEEVARATFAALELSEDEERSVRVGRGLDRDVEQGREYALFAPDGTFLALHASRSAGTGTKPTAVFV